MNLERFHSLSMGVANLRIVVIGDVCLDRYLEIDALSTETSIETGLPVYNVANVRAQPGGAGTVLNNLVALGAPRIQVVSFCGDDGEGHELRRALASLPGVGLDHFVTTSERRTFTYCKPLVVKPGREPVELNRIDTKNRTMTPATVTERMVQGLREAAPGADALIVLEQVDRAETGVTTRGLLQALRAFADDFPAMPILADSRRGLREWPPVSFKMNAAELGALLGRSGSLRLDVVKTAALDLARRNRRPIFVTLAERGIVGASPDGVVEHVPALPVHGPIDIVGAGDAVTANLAVALALGASLREAMELAMAAASVVIHQIGSTGTASLEAIAARLNDGNG